MDYQHREGGKTGSGGILSASEANADRRERLRRLALEVIDLSKDPYFMKNHLGTYECKLCLTLHTTEGSYLSHTQAKKHQANLGRRAAREATLNPLNAPLSGPAAGPGVQSPSTDVVPKKHVLKIGRPGYKISKIRDPITRYLGLLFMLHYPELPSSGVPRHRFMSAFEQRVEQPNKNYQYLLFAAEPYETIAFKVPSKEVESSESKFFSHWDPDNRIYTVQVVFRTDL